MRQTTMLDTPHREAEWQDGQRPALQAAACRAKEFLGDHPLTTSLAGFAIGFGAGLMIAAYSRSASRRRGNLAARWGDRMCGAVSDVLPKSWSH